VSDVILDASALIALLRAEPGHAVVQQVIAKASISTVNVAEVYSKAGDIGIPMETVIRLIAALPLRIVPFDQDQAIVVGLLRETTRTLGLSLGDRCCLALGLSGQLPVLTTDKVWSKLDLGIKVTVIRQ
jgi:PIN domain nuclease of toxin-antitoxin system